MNDKKTRNLQYAEYNPYLSLFDRFDGRNEFARSDCRDCIVYIQTILKPLVREHELEGFVYGFEKTWNCDVTSVWKRDSRLAGQISSEV